MKVLAVINQKGGSGKTTTTLNVGACLAREGYNVLLIDTDPQGNLTTSAGFADLNDRTVYEVLKGQADINDAILTSAGGYDVLPTDIRQSGADIELSAIPGREVLLKEALGDLRKDYDFIIIDCPPALSVITLMGLTACDKVIIPVQAQYLALQGMAQLLSTIELVKRRMNPRIDIGAVLLTMYDPRKNLDNEIKRNIAQAFPEKLLNTTIGHNVSLAEAPAYGMDIYQYKPNSAGAKQYEAVTDELIIKISN